MFFYSEDKKKPWTSKAKMWTTAEKRAVLKAFSKHLRNGEILKKDECTEFLKKNKKLMKDRTWTRVKDYVRNLGRKMKKNN